VGEDAVAAADLAFQTVVFRDVGGIGYLGDFR
jgi:hypothetical protein